MVCIAISVVPWPYDNACYFFCSVPITFTDRDGEVITVQAKIGDTLLEVAKEFDIDVEGACEGTLSCSTCHLIVDPDWFSKISDPLTEEEQDMLDLAYQPTDTYVIFYFTYTFCIMYP